jgi:hypothetical protein
VASRKLIVEIVGDSRSLDRAFKKSNAAASGFGSKMKHIGALAAAGIAVGVGAAIAFGVKAVKAANSLQESMFRVNRVFGKSAGMIRTWSMTTANALGINRDQALEFAGNLGLTLTNLGVGDKKAAGMSKRLVTLANDVALLNKANPEDVISGFQRGLTGMTRGLKKYGIVVDQTAIKNEAIRSGIADMVVSSGDVQKAQVAVTAAIHAQAAAIQKYGSNSEQAKAATANLTYQQEKLTKAIGGKMPQLTPLQKALATFNLITQKTTAAQGASQKRAGKWTMIWRRVHATIHDLTEEFGTGLLPVVNRVANALANKLADPKFREWVRKMGHLVGVTLYNAFLNITAWFKKNWPTILQDLRQFLHILRRIVNVADHAAKIIGKLGFLNKGPFGTGKVTTPEGVAKLPPGLRRKVMDQVYVNGDVHVHGVDDPKKLTEKLVRHAKNKSARTRGRTHPPPYSS